MTTPGSRPVPLAAVDSVDVIPGVGVVARKLVRADDPYLSGHYPGCTIYPGVFVIETASQAVERYVARAYGGRRSATLVAVDTVRFSRPLLPGDLLMVRADCAEAGAELTARVGCHDGADQPIARMTLRFGLTEEP